MCEFAEYYPTRLPYEEDLTSTEAESGESQTDERITYRTPRENEEDSSSEMTYLGSDTSDDEREQTPPQPWPAAPQPPMPPSVSVEVRLNEADQVYEIFVVIRRRTTHYRLRIDEETVTDEPAKRR